MAAAEMAESLQRVGEQLPELSVEERNLLSVAHGSFSGNRHAAWRIIASAEQKGKTTGNKQQALYEKKESLESDLADMKFDAGAGEDPFVKVKGLITCLIDRLQTEMSHVSHFDEETSMAAEALITT